MAFKFDFEERFENKEVENGTYEVIINKITEDVAKTGTKFLNVSYVIRNDVNQRSQNFFVWDRIWENKQTGKYNHRALNTLGWATNLDPNKEYNTLNAVIADLQYKPLKITVRKRKSEYNGETYENLEITRFERSDLPMVAHRYRESQPQQPQFSPLSDDDLPF